MSLQKISPQLLKVVEVFFNQLAKQSPLLFSDLETLSKQVHAQLKPIEENLSFINYLDVQKKIFKNIENNNKENWMDIYLNIYIQCIRQSDFAQKLFSAYLEQALNLIDKTKFEHVLIPGCGKFFEGSLINQYIEAKKITAVDILQSDLEISKTLNKNEKNIECLNRDLTDINNIDCNNAGSNTKESHDLMIFLHPQLCDYDKLWLTKAYKEATQEIDISPENMLNSSTVSFMPKAWVKILDNCFEKLDEQGHALFYFYEHRDLSIMLSYLKDKTNLEIKMQHMNNYIVDPAFSLNYIKGILEEKAQVANFVAMGAYRAVLLIEKKSK